MNTKFTATKQNDTTTTTLKWYKFSAVMVYFTHDSSRKKMLLGHSRFVYAHILTAFRQQFHSLNISKWVQRQQSFIASFRPTQRNNAAKASMCNVTIVILPSTNPQWLNFIITNAQNPHVQMKIFTC